RKEVGDDAFWEGISTYYATYQHANALTDNFRHIMEKASGKDLKLFFDQWLRQSGHPVLSGSWTYDAKKKEVNLVITQTQDFKFSTPIEIGV
ncbi:MAG TPA: peptidase, partial [Cytophagales bacterium]|nr:peptidase [Cytophagales bacterium]